MKIVLTRASQKLTNLAQKIIHKQATVVFGDGNFYLVNGGQVIILGSSPTEAESRLRVESVPIPTEFITGQHD